MITKKEESLMKEFFLSKYYNPNATNAENTAAAIAFARKDIKERVVNPLYLALSKCICFLDAIDTPDVDQEKIDFLVEEGDFARANMWAQLGIEK